jgi:hypothetical protein
MFNFKKDLQEMMEKTEKFKPGNTYRENIRVKNKNLPIVLPVFLRIVLSILAIIVLISLVAMLILWIFH